MLENSDEHDRDPVPGLAPLARPGRDTVPDGYIVRLKADAERVPEKPGLAPAETSAHRRRVWAAAQRARDAGIVVTREFIIIDAFAATMSPAQLHLVRQDPDVACVEQDIYYHLS